MRWWARFRNSGKTKLFKVATEMTMQTGPYKQGAITDIHIPFRSIVVLMVKIAIASIPVAIILTVITAIAFGFLKEIIGIL